MKIESVSWLNTVEGKMFEAKVFKIYSMFTTVLCVSLGFIAVKLGNINKEMLVNQRLIITPAVQREVVIPAKSYISEAFTRAVFERVVELNEMWSYETIKSNYDRLYRDFYSFNLSNITKSNILSSRRYDYVKKNEMVSFFKIDSNKSEYRWCEKLRKACGIVTGTRKVFIHHNEPFLEKEVSYLIIGESIVPNEENPRALKVVRAKMDDSSEAPYVNIRKQFDGALIGRMPDEA